jgi:hypothetical protein
MPAYADTLRHHAKLLKRELNHLHIDATLSQTQASLARMYGFPDWDALAAAADGLGSLDLSDADRMELVRQFRIDDATAARMLETLNGSTTH